MQKTLFILLCHCALLWLPLLAAQPAKVPQNGDFSVWRKLPAAVEHWPGQTEFAENWQPVSRQDRPGAYLRKTPDGAELNGMVKSIRYNGFYNKRLRWTLLFNVTLAIISL